MSLAVTSGPSSRDRRRLGLPGVSLILALGILTVSVPSEPQPARAPRIGLFHVGLDHVPPSLATLRGELKALGYENGRNTYLDVTAKQIELFKEMVPGLRRVLVLTDPHDPVAPRQLGEVRRAASKLQLRVFEGKVSSEAESRRVFGSVSRRTVDGVFVASVDLQTKYSALLIRLATAKRLPLSTHRKEWVQEGALFSYAPHNPAMGRAAAPYVHKILTGTKPESLPVDQASQLELAVNLKTARALGITVTQPVLVRADYVFR